jgi:hypothetical protein
MFESLIRQFAAAAIGAALASSAFAGPPVSIDIQPDSSITGGWAGYGTGEVLTLGGQGRYHLPKVAFQLDAMANKPLTLYAAIYDWHGDGVYDSGALSTSSLVTVTSNSLGKTWYDFNFAQQAALTAGHRYLIGLVLVDGTPPMDYLSIGMHGSGTDAFPAGEMVYNQGVGTDWQHWQLFANDDLALRATFVPGATAVPEPSTVALFGLGMAGLALRRRAGMATR